MNKQTIFRIQRPGVFSNEFEVKIGVRVQSDTGVTIAIAKPLVVETININVPTDHIPPTFSMSPEDAQALMDELWHVGIRPSEGSGSAGQMADVLNHLNDMRHIAFDRNPPQP